MQCRGVDPGCVDIALSGRRGDGADGDAATLQLHVHVTVKGFLLRAERCIAAAGTAWHKVVMAIAHAVSVAAFGVDPGMLVRAVHHSQRGIVGDGALGEERAVAEDVEEVDRSEEHTSELQYLSSI